MRWPWRRRCNRDADGALAIEHVAHAERALTDATNLAARADQVSDELTETLRRNHFAAAVTQAMRGYPLT